MFVSNTGISTSHNYHVVLEQGETATFRILLKPVQAGPLDWRFFFSNTVDSTFADGSVSRANMPGGRFEIVSASVSAADEARVPGAFWPVTWQGRAARVVEPDERLTSDSVRVNVPEGGYIVFSWCLRGLAPHTVVPATPDSQSLCYRAAGEAASSPMQAFAEDNLIVAPDGFEADRRVKAQMAFIGDSITQGCGTRVNFYEQWVARIARGIESDVAVWNIGLGYGRGMDAALNGAWLEKAARADIVNVCLGVNDLGIGERTSAQIIESLRAVVAGLRERNRAVKVVLFTVPAFDYVDQKEIYWREVNESIRSAGHLGADALFDMAAMVGQAAPNENRSFFGGHPDGRGGAAVAGEYLTAFWPAHRRELMPR